MEQESAVEKVRDNTEQTIDVLELFEIFWDRRIRIAKITGIFLLIGLLFGLASPVEYSTNARLMPETNAQGSVGGLLQQYGGFLGIGGASNVATENGIPPKLYPDIVKGLPYLIELSSTQLQFSKFDTTATVHIFFEEIYGLTFLDFLKRYTIGLPGQISGIFSSGDDKSAKSILQKVDQDSIVAISEEQMKTIRRLRERITVEYDDQSGIVTLSAEMPDPVATAELGQKGITLLKEYLKEYRTEKAINDLEFVKEQFEEAKKRFEDVQGRLAEFRDSNLNLATAKAQTRLQELQSQYDLAFNLYNSLSQRLEEAKMRVQEETPVFSVLQPVTLPLYNSRPNWFIIIPSSILLGLVGGLGWALINGIEEKFYRRV